MKRFFRDRRPLKTGIPAFVIAVVMTLPAWGGNGRKPGSDGVSEVLNWNTIAIDTSGRDHGGVREQLGPGRSSKAIAMVQIAIFDVVNAIEGGYESYAGIERVGHNTSLKAAIAQAAHDTLVDQFPAQAAIIDAELEESLEDIQDSSTKTKGIELGKQAAAAIIAAREDDGSIHDDPLMGSEWHTSDDPGHWRQDPVSPLPIALGAHWGDVLPFVLESSDQFRTPPPPDMNSEAYTRAFNEVKRLGGDGDITPTERTEEQGIIGVYWAYDGTPALCAPPRLYNQIAVNIAETKKLNTIQLARMLALINVAMADAGIAIWESKYHWDFWRPVTGIREADPNTGPTGLGDGNDDTLGDVTFTPLGAPASNLEEVFTDFTPPFPAYPSGHAGFGGALFQTLRRFYGTDDIPFTFISDEFNGVTQDDEGNTRPLVSRSFQTLSQAEEENGQSRIYLGIHWEFDKTEGIAQGRQVADFVFDNAFKPLPKGNGGNSGGQVNGGGGDQHN